MELAVNLAYRDAAAIASAAEDLGYAVAVAPEGYRSDAASLLGLVAGRTQRIALLSGVMQIPARAPGMAALTAATLDAMSGGRFRLGLGVSNADVSEGWYGVPFDKPLARAREYVDIVRAALRGGPVRYEGRHFRLPPAGQPAEPLQLLTQPLRGDLPIYLAAVGAKNIQLAGEIADGWIGVFASPEGVEESVRHLRAGAMRIRGTHDSDAALPGESPPRPMPAGFDVMISVPTSVEGDLDRAADPWRAYYAHFIGMGARERNVYCALATRLGFGGEIDKVHGLARSGDRQAAAAALPFGFIDRTALLGPVPRIAARIRDYAEAGATTLNILLSPSLTDAGERIAVLRAVAQALATCAHPR